MKRIISFILLFVSVTSCKEKYDIVLKDSDKSLIVVEGFLNAGTGPTQITITKSFTRANPGSIPKVSNAQVSVEGDNGTSYALSELGTSGVYQHNQLNLSFSQQYRLRIKTPDNKEYLSDYVPVLQSPVIDSVSWKWENNGVMFYVSTHDATNNSRYYKWEYDETWQINSIYFSFVKMINSIDIVPRDLTTEDVSRCWKYGKSNSILIGTTSQLQSDVAHEIPLFYLPANIEKIGVRYSPLVKQTVIPKQAYEYFNLMKKNTEQLGSIFDPLPSELRGNIKCISNPSEQVIGYITAGTQTEKRIFINSTQLPNSYFPGPSCFSVLIANHPDSIRKYTGSFGYLPYMEELDIFNNIVGYHAANPVCSDCTRRGGSNVKPLYW